MLGRGLAGGGGGSCKLRFGATFLHAILFWELTGEKQKWVQGCWHLGGFQGGGGFSLDSEGQFWSSQSVITSQEELVFSL